MNPLLSAFAAQLDAYTPGEEDAWALLARAAKEPTALSLETLVTHPLLGGFTEASELQRVLMRAADGHEPRQWLTEEEALEHFNMTPETVWPFSPVNPPPVMIPRAGIRCGKSLIAALALIRSVLIADFAGSGVREGEYVRAVVLTPAVETAKGTFAHVKGTMLASPVLRRLLVKDPGAESLQIRRPDGRTVTILLLAAKAKGLNLRATWLAGLVLDEAEFHLGEESQVNLPDNFDAAMPRMLRRAQPWVPSSPWADTGPFHDLHKSVFGEPGKGDAAPGPLLAFHSSSRALNPSLDPVQEAAMRARDPDKAAREYDGRPLSSLSTQFFTPIELTMSIDVTRGHGDHLPPIPGVGHSAGSDAGFVKNSSALAIARDNPESGVVELAYHSEDRPAKNVPLVPSVVVGGWVRECETYGVDEVHGDKHYSEAIREHLAKGEWEIAYRDFQPSAESTLEMATIVKGLMAANRCRVPNDPVLVAQLRGMQSKAIGGRTQVAMPRDGTRHGDVLFAALIALSKAQEATARAAGSGKGYYRNRSGSAYADALAGRSRGDTRSRW
jgi:hypothetical protein